VHRIFTWLFRSLLLVTLVVYLYRLYYTFIEPPPPDMLYECISPSSFYNDAWQRTICFDHVWMPLSTLLIGVLLVMWLGFLAALLTVGSQ